MMSSGKILITGAGGMLGSMVAQDLIAQGLSVITTGRNPPDRPLSVQQVCGDLRDAGFVHQLVSASKVSAILHLAAVIPGRQSGDHDFTGNVGMTRNLLSAARAASVMRFVLASSVAVYGTAGGPFNEHQELGGAGPYPESKIAEERLLEEAVKEGWLSGCALRVAAPYGGRPSVMTVINKFLTQAASGQHITVFGGGTREQHFVHVSDVARAFYLALNSEVCGAFNLSGPAPVSMLSLAQLCVSALGTGSEIQMTGTDPQESFRGCYPWALAHERFGYTPATDLAEGLVRTAAIMGLR